MPRAALCWWLLGLLLSIGPACAELAVPELRHRVTDTAGMLTPAQRDDLTALLRAQPVAIAVLLVDSTLPETIEQYAIRVADAWLLGDRKRDDGILILVARSDRRMRIEVGYGLEGDLPDARAKRIVDEAIAPRFKQKDYYGGVRAGIEAIAAALSRSGAPR